MPARRALSNSSARLRFEGLLIAAGLSHGLIVRPSELGSLKAFGTLAMCATRSMMQRRYRWIVSLA